MEDASRGENDDTAEYLTFLADDLTVAEHGTWGD
jgi:hypothetical protein